MRVEKLGLTIYIPKRWQWCLGGKFYNCFKIKSKNSVETALRAGPVQWAQLTRSYHIGFKF